MAEFWNLVKVFLVLLKSFSTCCMEYLGRSLQILHILTGVVVAGKLHKLVIRTFHTSFTFTYCYTLFS